MPDLNFQIEGAQPVPYAADPLLAFKLRVRNEPAEENVQTVVLRTQIQIEAGRRRYGEEEQQRLRDLFGDPDRWSQTLRSMLWTHISLVVPSFSESILVDLPVPCTFDFNVAATKYFHGITEGHLPLLFLFSGTAFYQSPERQLQVAPIPWDRDARFRLPVQTWREVMDFYYPNSAWLTVHRDVFDRLHDYKVRSGIPTWEQTMERLLACVEEMTQT